MKTFVQEGKALDLTAPEGGVTSGLGVMIGSLFAIAAVTAAAGETFAGYVEGVFDHPADDHETTQAWTEGMPVYFDESEGVLTKTGAGNILVGVAAAAKASTATIGRVKLTTPFTAGAAIASLEEDGGAIEGTNDGDLPDLTATAATLTGTLTGSVNGAIADVAAVSTAGGNTYSDAAINAVVADVNVQLKELQTTLNAVIADNVNLRAAIREVAAKVNEILALG